MTAVKNASHGVLSAFDDVREAFERERTGQHDPEKPAWEAEAVLAACYQQLRAALKEPANG